MAVEKVDRSVAGEPARSGGWLKRVVWSIPLGWQLSVLYTLLLAITLTVVGAVVYSQQEGFLVRDAGQRLQDNAHSLVDRQNATPFGGPNGPQNGRGGRYPYMDHDGDNSPVGTSTGLLENLVRGLSGPDITVAVLDTSGAVITATQGLEGDTAPTVNPVSQEQLTTALSGQPVQWVVTGDDGGREVVVLMRIIWRQQTFGGQVVSEQTLLVEQAASLVAADAALGQLGTLLLIGIIVGTVAGVVLGLAFTRAVLHPLDRVAGTAEAIAGGDLQRRLQLPAGRNEVARLGKAFDYMVGRLVSTLEAQRRFVADASHELRTPLTSMRGLAEILMIGAHGNDSRVIEQSAGAIHDELTRLSRLVNDLLTLSRFDSTGNGAPPARRIPMDAAATVRAAADQMAPLAEARGVRLTYNASSALNVLGDAGQIKQVLINLLDNALRYTPAGGEVAVSGAVEGGSAVIQVRDSGSGIAPADLPHIFERFYRGDASRTRATGNSGLGLAIVGAIIEAHAGTIGVVSTLGAGTTFTIKLPLLTGHAKEEEKTLLAAAEVAARH